MLKEHAPPAAASDASASRSVHVSRNGSVHIGSVQVKPIRVPPPAASVPKKGAVTPFRAAASAPLPPMTPAAPHMVAQRRPSPEPAPAWPKTAASTAAAPSVHISRRGSITISSGACVAERVDRGTDEEEDEEERPDPMAQAQAIAKEMAQMKHRAFEWLVSLKRMQTGGDSTTAGGAQEDAVATELDALADHALRLHDASAALHDDLGTLLRAQQADADAARVASEAATRSEAQAKEAAARRAPSPPTAPTTRPGSRHRTVVR